MPQRLIGILEAYQGTIMEHLDSYRPAMAKERVYALVCRIPPGKVMSYGQVGDYVDPPVSARRVGRILFHAPAEVPWWRVVGADGTLRIRRRDPLLAKVQQAYLRAEGTTFTPDGRVEMKRHRWEPTGTL